MPDNEEYSFVGIHAKIRELEKELSELKDKVHSIEANIMNWQDAWVKVSNSYLCFNDIATENREVLRGYIKEVGNYLDTDRFEYLLEKLSGEKDSIDLSRRCSICGKDLNIEPTVDPLCETCFELQCQDEKPEEEDDDE